jgi:hypothetical protein
MHAAAVCFNSLEERDVAAVVIKGTQAAPTPAIEINKAYRTPPSLPGSCTREEALALFVNKNMTKGKCLLIREEAEQRR